MKTNPFFSMALLAGAMAAAVACSKGGEPARNSEPVEVKFSSGIAELQSRVSGATGTNWEANDPVGIYMIGASGGLTTGNILEGAGNRHYKVAAAGTGASFTPVGSPIYYPATGDVKFIAYHPYSASVGSDFKVPLSVAVQSNQSAIDVLYAPAGTAYNKNSAAANLPFAHKLVKLLFHISAGEGVTEGELNGLVVKISGQQSAGTMDLTNGAVTASGAAGEITALTTTDGKSSEAIVLPGSTAGVSFTFTTSGANYTVGVPAGTTSWAGGYQYTYMVTLKKDEATVTGTVSPWGDGGNETIVVQSDIPTIQLLDNATDPNSCLVEYNLSATQYERLIDYSYFSTELRSITNQVYEQCSDDFDFVFYVLDQPQSSEILNALGFYGVNIGVSNAVQGTGRSIYSNAALWGSAGKLKSVMYFPMYDAIHRGPALHELCHNWGAYICPTYAPDGLRYDGHWGVSNAGGQLGGFKYLRTVEVNSGGEPGKTLYQASFYPDTNPDGSFKSGFGVNANGGNGPLYSDIELYVMGMKSAQELRDANFKLDIYTGCSYDPSSFGSGYFWATGITSYTIDDIITANGARVPDAATAQKSFKVMTVVLTGEGVTAHHYADIIKGVSWIAGPTGDNSYPGWGINNFREATGGVGELVATGVKESFVLTRSMTRSVATPNLPQHPEIIHVDKIDNNLLHSPR